MIDVQSLVENYSFTGASLVYRRKPPKKTLLSSSMVYNLLNLFGLPTARPQWCYLVDLGHYRGWLLVIL